MSDTTTLARQDIPTYPDIEGRVAVVTGGSKGIGAATCRVLAANGARVAVAARSRPGIDALVDELRGTGAQAIGFSGDAGRLADMERLCDVTAKELGPPDILIAFAGGFTSYTPLQEIEEQEWRQVLDANLTSTFLTMKAFMPSMMRARHGAVVTMASNSARLLDIPLTASYAAAKAGVVQLTRHAAKELGPHGIRVNCIAPATTLSERVEGIMSEEIRRRVIELCPLGRLGTPEDSALATLFLSSASASWLTGVTIDIAGGRVML
jgi:3-oxoacyl-[acyl-carrier protein] reductase